MTRSSSLLGLLIGLACSACVVLPTTKTTVRNAGTERSPLRYGPAKAIVLQTGSSHTDVRVRATSQRECQRTIYAVDEVTKSKHARFGVDDPRGRVLGFVLAPVTVPISAIITGLVVASSDDETTRVTKPLRTETVACTKAAAGLALDLQFPSGHVLRGKTDANGVLVAAIPVDEPYIGDVVVNTANGSVPVHYEQLVPPVTAARDAIETCRAQHNVASVTLKLAIDDHGVATHVSASTGDASFSACITTRIARVVFPSALRNTTVVLPFEAPTT